MPIRKVIANPAVISFLLLGMFYNADLKAQALRSCSELPGGGLTSSAPGVVTGVLQSGVGLLDIFIRGTDSRIYVDGTHSGSLSPWFEIPGGGFTSSGPAAVLHGGIVKVFIRGFGNGIWENDLNGTNWSGWSAVPGSGLTIAGPSALIDRGILKLFVTDIATVSRKTILAVAAGRAGLRFPGRLDAFSTGCRGAI